MYSARQQVFCLSSCLNCYINTVAWQPTHDKKITMTELTTLQSSKKHPVYKGTSSEGGVTSVNLSITLAILLPPMDFLLAMLFSHFSSNRLFLVHSPACKSKSSLKILLLLSHALNLLSEQILHHMTDVKSHVIVPALRHRSLNDNDNNSNNPCPLMLLKKLLNQKQNILLEWPCNFLIRWSHHNL